MNSLETFSGVLAGVPAVDIGAVTRAGIVGLERHRLLLVDYVLKVRPSLADGLALELACDLLAVLVAHMTLPKHGFRRGVGIRVD